MRQILAAIQDPDGAADQTSIADRLVLAGRTAVQVSGVGLSWMTDSGPGGMVAATDSSARLVEELQFSLGEGPCVDSTATGRPALHPDLARSAPGRWPAFGVQALAAGIAAVFAFPLRVGAINVGVLDMYRDTPGQLTEEDLLESLAFAGAATSVLLHLRLPAKDGDQRPDLADPFIGRAEVHQASGMVAVQADVSLADALTLLRARAFASGRPVADVARDVVTRTLRFDP